MRKVFLFFGKVRLVLRWRKKNIHTFSIHISILVYSFVLVWPRLFTNGNCRPDYGVGYSDPRYSGGLIQYGYQQHYDVKDWEACGKLCFNARGCTHWMWNKEHSMCHLQNHAYSKRHDSYNDVHGSYNCFRSHMC